MKTNEELEQNSQNTSKWKPSSKVVEVDKIAQKIINSISNNITSKVESVNKIDKTKSDASLNLNCSIKPRNIEVTQSRNTVNLIGTVSSRHQRDDEGTIAWGMLGGWPANKDLEVDHS